MPYRWSFDELRSLQYGGHSQVTPATVTSTLYTLYNVDPRRDSNASSQVSHCLHELEFNRTIGFSTESSPAAARRDPWTSPDSIRPSGLKRNARHSTLGNPGTESERGERGRVEAQSTTGCKEAPPPGRKGDAYRRHSRMSTSLGRGPLSAIVRYPWVARTTATATATTAARSECRSPPPSTLSPSTSTRRSPTTPRARRGLSTATSPTRASAASPSPLTASSTKSKAARTQRSSRANLYRSTLPP
ncbi:hypothetical protein K431DRAFT_55828 [Polychaeton citri CBS 116435]|uniref:Uncharacterized protein n=1 Tax=Polychaeton citri CBS 116435 TaxID=1314669 RepID=A0A9P4QI20_9PEZI|nr:hypothetical protein K431DRAFT_55828 [Polychaeton citri CBS 116435]